MTTAASVTARQPSFWRSVIDMFVAPSAAFAALRARRGWARWALLTLALAQAVAIWGFVAPMPADWLVAQQLQQMGELPAGEHQQTQAQLLSLAPHYAWLSALGAALGMVLLTAALGSAYGLLGAIAAPRRVTFADSLRLAVWTQWPSLFQALAIIVLAWVASPQRPLGLANFASLNELWLHWTPDHSGYLWASSLNLFLLWSALLAMVGWRCWSGASLGRAALLASLPYLLVFGLWAAVVWS